MAGDDAQPQQARWVCWPSAVAANIRFHWAIKSAVIFKKETTAQHIAKTMILSCVCRFRLHRLVPHVENPSSLCTSSIQLAHSALPPEEHRCIRILATGVGGGG